MTENEIGKRIIDVAIRVHRELGPGLLEMVYEIILAYELRQKQLLTYLRLTGMRLGYLLNFSDALMKDGIVRTVNCLIENEK